MRSSPAFWWRPATSLAAALLAPVGWLYGRLSGRRMLRRPNYSSKLPVICIGNFVVGGTGKTPFAIALAQRLKREGFHPLFLLRGYGGTEKGPIVVDPDRHRAADVGDEALLLAREGLTIVAADRPAGARLAETLDTDMILMDDGFQNPSLEKNLSLALVDSIAGLGNGKCLPAGPMRVPLTVQILKTDALVQVGQPDTDVPADTPVLHAASRKGVPLFKAWTRSEGADQLPDSRYFAFAGIGRPEKFFSSLKAEGLHVVKTRVFADHHVYSENDAKSLLQAAEDGGLQLITTAKDMVRLETERAEIFRWLAARSKVLDIAMHIEDEDRLIGLIRDMLRRRSFRA